MEELQLSTCSSDTWKVGFQQDLSAVGKLCVIRGGRISFTEHGSPEYVALQSDLSVRVRKRKGERRIDLLFPDHTNLSLDTDHLDKVWRESVWVMVDE
jgi:hypothetical protein